MRIFMLMADAGVVSVDWCVRETIRSDTRRRTRQEARRAVAKDFGDLSCLMGEEVVAYLKKEAICDVGYLVGRLSSISKLGVCLGRQQETDATATTAWIPLNNVAFLIRSDQMIFSSVSKDE